MKRTFQFLTALALLAGASLTHAGIHHWNGGGDDELWSNPANWIEGAPTAGEAAPVQLEFPIAGVKSLTNDIPGLTVDTLRLFGSGYVLRGLNGASLTLRGGQTTTLYCRGVNTIAASLPVILEGTSVIEVDGGTNVLTLSSVISGTGGLTKVGLGALLFASANHNTYAGPTTVLRGPLRLSNQNLLQNKIAIPGPLVIGESNPTNSPNVRLLAHHQIANTSPVTINENGTLRLDGYDDTIGALTMTGGTIYTDDGADIGTLMLGGDVTYHHTPVIVGGIAGHLSLGTATRTFNIVSGTLNLDAIEGGPAAGLLKTGSGTLGLVGASAYQGHTTVNGGYIRASHPQAFGLFGTDASGTTVNWPGGISLYNNTTVIGEKLFLNDLGELYATGTCGWSASVTVTGAAEMNVFGALCTVEGVISGPGTLVKTGLGTLRLEGPTANIHTGGTLVRHGTLQLAKSSGVAAIPGSLTVGDGLGASDADQVVLMAHNQIADDAEILIKESGLLNVNGFVESLGPIALDGGHLDSGGLFLQLVGDVTTLSNANTSAFIDGRFFLSGSGVFDTHSGGVTAGLQIRGQIIGDANHPFVKRGLGTLRLSHTNNLYDGLTLVQEGYLWLTKGVPGSTVSGTVVSNFATLAISQNTTVGSESLVLPGNGAPGNPRDAFVSFFGTNWWGGPITLAGHAAIRVEYAADLLILHGAITGNYSLTKIGAGTLEFSGDVANSYTSTDVRAGVLALDKVPGATAIPGALSIGFSGTNTVEVRLLGANQIHNLSAVSLTTNGLFNLNHQLETIGSLAGAGRVNLGFGSLRAGSNNTDTTYSGAISGIIAASFTKEGSGRMILTGTNTYPGKTFVNAGNLFINGQQSSPVAVNPGGSLNGHGVVGALTVTNGLLSPGSDGLFGPGVARLNSGNVALNSNSGFWIDLGGTDAGTNYCQLNVIGTVNLGDAGLSVKLAFASIVSNRFMIVKNDGIDPIVGTFKGLPHGATTYFNGAQFQISYFGGTGNDVVLTQLTLSAPPQLGGIIQLGNGQIQITGSGLPGVSYIVQGNTNLATTNWVNLGATIAQPPAGALQFIDVDATNYPMRFYRFVAP